MAKHNTNTEGNKRLAARKRNFATIVYPESAPDDWRDQLDAAHVPVLISPLHDQDVNPDSTPKKPHYHVLFMYDTPQDFEATVKPVFDSIGAVGRESVSNKRGYARYLCHLDNPEKTKYNPDDVTALAGADYKSLIHLPTDDIGILRDIMDFARTNKIYSFAHLLDICAANNDDWFNLLVTSRGYIVKEYVKGLRWEHDSNYVRINADLATGEIINSHDQQEQDKTEGVEQ